jgi:phosphoglycerate kinase
MSKLRLSDLSLKGKRVLMRVDFNVPLDKNLHISDDTRIALALPSIQFILSKGASLILMSHLGRPEGAFIKEFSLKPCAEALSQLLKKEVLMAPDCIGSAVTQLAQHLNPGQILLLENLRFHEAEEFPDKDPSFAKQLASLADIYVNDAFGSAHRAHSSTATIAQYFPEKAAMGFLMEREVNFLQETLKQPKRPFYAILGGAKIASKMGVFTSLLSKVDGLFIGGGMAYTFLKVLGFNIGKSIFDPKMESVAKEFLATAKKKEVCCFFPKDLVIAPSCENTAPSNIVSIEEGVPNDWMGLDIGPKTLETWSSTLKKASTIFWNGPVGVFELSHFSQGTFNLAKFLASLSATTIVGGGDSVAAINTLGLKDHFTHVSTGGGASLELIEYGHLPGVDALSDKKSV